MRLKPLMMYVAAPCITPRHGNVNKNEARDLRRLSAYQYKKGSYLALPSRISSSESSDALFSIFCRLLALAGAPDWSSAWERGRRKRLEENKCDNMKYGSCGHSKVPCKEVATVLVFEWARSEGRRTIVLPVSCYDLLSCMTFPMECTSRTTSFCQDRA